MRTFLYLTDRFIRCVQEIIHPLLVDKRRGLTLSFPDITLTHCFVKMQIYPQAFQSTTQILDLQHNPQHDFQASLVGR